MKDYFRKSNPEYINIICEIETIESRINSGIITNNKTLKYKNRDLKRLYEKLKITDKYLD
ncbi:hypothetical protein [Chryseobacterium sp. JV274]|uniref:hypothetical protein n=1 Tax=Chryseobacterium sp. JV274 TaxID=1932669 RepID=UPI0015C25696|nr:hypothetical protein [Chryseobacterium sp. JV274]CAD0220382.1 protein of unknown function [Chryseobacterium sp. JV274]